jgi:RND family efflux transporter MFP subunit
MRVELAFRLPGYVEDISKIRVDGKKRPIDQGDPVKKGTRIAKLRDTDYRVKLAQAEAGAAEKRAAADQARQDFARAKQMFESDVLPLAQFEAAKTKMFAADATVLAASAVVDEARLALQDCSLRAPIDGVIFERLVEEGSMVAPGAPSFVLMDTSCVKIVFGVPDRMLKDFPIDAELDVIVEAAGPAPFKGTVASAAPTADSKSRLFEIEVKLKNSDGRFRPGMAASVALKQKDTPSTISVPLSAVVRPPGGGKGFAVFVVDNGVLKPRTIVPGKLCSNRIEIVSGIIATDRVVVDGAADSFDGELVAVVP